MHKQIALFSTYKGQEKTFTKDQCTWGFLSSLLEKLSSQGFEWHTLDYYQKKKITPDILLHVNTPWDYKKIPFWENKQVKKVLYLMEPELRKPHGWGSENIQKWDIIFTYKKQFVDNKKVFFAGYFVFCDLSSPVKKRKDFFCTFINSNIFPRSKLKRRRELYSKRRELIQWFQKNHPDDFCFYGYGWNRYVSGSFTGKVFRKLLLVNRIPFLQRLLVKKWMKCYGGEVNDKCKTLTQYKFVICTENRIEMDYVSEKIVDAIWSRTVPIYLGAPNITDYIPASCFIDLRKFGNNYESLYTYLKNIDEETYKQYQIAIEEFIDSPQGHYYVNFESKANKEAQILFTKLYQ